MSEPDPSLLPVAAVMRLLVACEQDSPDAARGALHPDLIGDIEASERGWPAWWWQAKRELTGFGDQREWTFSTTMDLVWHATWQQHGHRVSIVRRQQAPIEPGGVTTGGEPYEVLSLPTIAERTFWVAETDDGWKVRGFDALA